MHTTLQSARAHADDLVEQEHAFEEALATNDAKHEARYSRLKATAGEQSARQAGAALVTAAAAASASIDAHGRQASAALAAVAAAGAHAQSQQASVMAAQAAMFLEFQVRVGVHEPWLRRGSLYFHSSGVSCLFLDRYIVCLVSVGRLALVLLMICHLVRVELAVSYTSCHSPRAYDEYNVCFSYLPNKVMLLSREEKRRSFHLEEHPRLPEVTRAVFRATMITACLRRLLLLSLLTRRYQGRSADSCHVFESKYTYFAITVCCCQCRFARDVSTHLADRRKFNCHRPKATTPSSIIISKILTTACRL